MRVADMLVKCAEAPGSRTTSALRTEVERPGATTVRLNYILMRTSNNLISNKRKPRQSKVICSGFKQHSS